MLRRFHLVSVAALPVALLLLSVASRPAHADSYTVTTVAYSQSESFVGLDATGNFVVNVTNTISFMHPTCGGVAVSPYSQCFETFYADQANPVFSTSAPSLIYDNGSTCTPNLGNQYDVFTGRCNNGYEIFSGIFGNTHGVWAGTDQALSFLNTGSFDGGFINSHGDAVFIDGHDNTLIFAANITTNPIPEPASWMLLVTGGIFFFGALRRKVGRRYNIL